MLTRPRLKVFHVKEKNFKFRKLKDMINKLKRLYKIVYANLFVFYVKYFDWANTIIFIVLSIFVRIVTYWFFGVFRIK